MLVGLLRYLRGSVQFSIEGSPERFYNQCAKQGIPLWGMCAGSEHTAFAIASQYARLRLCARRSGCRLHLQKKLGLPFRISFMRKRKGIPAGILLTVCLVLFLSSRVWSIEVSGCKEIREEDLRTACQEAGLSLGMAKSELDPHKMQQRLMQRFPEISWLTVNTSGSTVHIQLTEGVEKPEMTDTEHVGNMKAAVAGQVLRIEVFSGKAAVSVGEAVAPGQLLISGTVENGASPAVRADGRIIAKTTRTFSTKVPLVEETKAYTGETLVRRSLNIFGVPLPMSLTTAPMKGNWERSGSVTILKANGSRLPVYWTEEIWKQVEKGQRERSREEAEELARKEIEKQEKELSELKILEQEEQFEIREQTLYCTVTIICEENIAIQSEILIK